MMFTGLFCRTAVFEMLCYNDAGQSETDIGEKAFEQGAFFMRREHMLEIRTAQLEDLDQIATLEQRCFLPEEAAGRESIRNRLKTFPNHFWLLEHNGLLVSLVDGMVSDQKHLSDEMYDDAKMHEEDGRYQMIFGVETDPDYAGRGYASLLMKQVIRDCIDDSRKGIILHCKDEYIPFYAKLGFVLEGEADSTHGGKKWNLMVMNLEPRL